jgi:acyl-CoA thioesterase-1
MLLLAGRMQVLQRFSLVVLGLLVLGGIYYVRAGSSRAAAPTSGTAVIALGDSLVSGKGASAGRDFVAVLSRRLRTPIINAGRSGDTSAEALARLDRDVLSRDPRVVIVLLGGNDFLQKVPRDQTFANLSTIVDRIRRRGAAVVLVGINPGLWMDPYAAEFEDLARRLEAGLVPDILADILGNSALMSDAIHPNDRGYELMADRIEPMLRGLIE